jgi:hypothetical protein
MVHRDTDKVKAGDLLSSVLQQCGLQHHVQHLVASGKLVQPWPQDADPQLSTRIIAGLMDVVAMYPADVCENYSAQAPRKPSTRAQHVVRHEAECRRLGLSVDWSELAGWRVTAGAGAQAIHTAACRSRSAAGSGTTQRAAVRNDAAGLPSRTCATAG